MENKINIANILKDCPRDMELDCTIWNGVTFGGIDSSSPSYPIEIKIKDDKTTVTEYLTKFGEWNTNENSKCVIFPKGKTTWEGFVPPIEFKEGDIIYTLVEGDLEFISIFKKANETLIYTYVALGSTLYRGNGNGLCKKNDIKLQRFASEDEKQVLFDAIKDNGYRWNAEKKTLEELIKPIFKKGDKVRVKNGVSECCVIIDNVEDTFYSLAPIGKIDFTDQNRWELIPNKFDINTLVPFESRVLVRDYTNSIWLPALWGIYNDNDNSSYPYKLVGTMSRYCIPYEGNEHLLGKTTDCDEFYKTWK